MPSESCANCGRKVNWGNLFPKNPEKPRKCPLCKKSFDIEDLIDGEGRIKLAKFMGRKR